MKDMIITITLKCMRDYSDILNKGSTMYKWYPALPIVHCVHGISAA